MQRGASQRGPLKGDHRAGSCQSSEGQGVGTRKGQDRDPEPG